MIANVVLRQLVPEYYRRWGVYKDPIVLMFDEIYRQYPEVFPRMFKKMRVSGVRLSDYQEPYLSHIVYSFMFHGTGDKHVVRYFVIPPMPQVNPATISEIEERFRIV